MADAARRGLLLAAAAAAAGVRAAPSPPSAEPVEMDAGVWMLQGAPGEPEPANRGRTGNCGFVVGRQGVAVVDAGASARQADDLLAAIARVTDKPVLLALLTQARQEAVLGAAALQAKGIPVWMAKRAADAMAARCYRCLEQLRKTLGEDEMRGSALVKPDHLLGDGYEVIETIGRPLFVQPHVHASGPGATVLHDVRTGGLFAGALVGNRRIPDLDDADLDGWRDALAGLRTLRVSTVLPAHGAGGSPELIDETDRYLLKLRARVAVLVKAGAPLIEVPDAAALPDYAGWDGYATLHRRNASQLYVRLERQLYFGDGAPPRGR